MVRRRIFSTFRRYQHVFEPYVGNFTAKVVASRLPTVNLLFTLISVCNHPTRNDFWLNSGKPRRVTVVPEKSECGAGLELRHQYRGVSRAGVFVVLLNCGPRIRPLWPRKGEIRVRSDADLILVNLERNWTLEPEMLYSRHRHSPHVGLEFSVWIEQVFLRGHAVTTDGTVIASPYGCWLRPSHLSGHSMTVQHS
jgi:hypothetical protein